MENPLQTLRVAITTAIGHKGLELLCPHRELRWNQCEFLLNPPRGTTCDYWIVWAASRDRDSMRVAPQNTLFIAGEPPSKKIYPKKFYAQFQRVVSTHAADPHPRVTTSLPGLNWHVGLDRNGNRYTYGYDELKLLRPEGKTDKISVVCSNLTTTPGQRQRLALLDYLKSELGDAIVHYGRGFTPIGDKMAAILPHAFHLVLENSCSPDYWTEKLSDAYLGWAHPIYAGCPNLGDYFPTSGFTAVEVTRPEATLDIIRAKLRQRLDPGPLAQCRDLILDTYNPFARFAHWAEAWHQPGLPAIQVRVTSHRAFRPFPNNWLHRIKSRLKPSSDP